MVAAPRRAWRFRRCPECGDVFAAGTLIQLDLGSNWGGHGASRCKCPDCGHVAPRAEFPIVRERRRGGGAS